MTRHSQSRFDLVESILFSSYDIHLEGGGLVPQSRWWASCSRTGAQAGPLVAFCNTHTSPILLPLTPTSLSHTLSPSHHSNNIFRILDASIQPRTLKSHLSTSLPSNSRKLLFFLLLCYRGSVANGIG